MQGWCSTRDPGVDEDVEPSPAKDWGFCWEHASQDNCNSEIKDVINHRAVAVSLLRQACHSSGIASG